MEIAVLVKPVPDAETRLRPDPAGKGLDPEGVKWVLAGYDESAVEQALLLKESAPGTTVRAISYGPAVRADEVLRAAIALGCDRATSVEAPAGVADDPLVTAAALHLALSRFPASLVLCGKQTGDHESGLVGPAVAELLAVPEYGVAVNVRLDAGGAEMTLQQSVEGGLLRLRAKLPALVALQQAWNDPRTAKLPNILKSRKAPIDRVPAADVAAAVAARLPLATRRLAFRLPPPRTGAKMIEYKTPEEAAQKLVRILREKAKVFP
ncbi:MAG: electron transfer flavoprotein subunit beta/FixA family protein [Thermoplasmata archaeon]|nr:electron transfer flavoprotein subunit beta/FixA family protein [Thermoplasmata archaeon]MCI4361741.1 electron transfer flavoprotein subunit beta/FixA family protein [Thermoplasmata archaeon]